jgi:hypothetical protein
VFSATGTRAETLNWEKVVGSGVATFKGFGNPLNLDCSRMIQFGDYLYAATRNSGGIEIWRTNNGVDWLSVVNGGFNDVNNTDIWNFAEFNGWLYAGTANFVTGGELWRTSNGTSWEQVGGDGFGSANNTAATNIIVFNNYLYVGTYNTVTGANLFSSPDGVGFGVVTANGLGGGAVNEIFLSSTIFKGELYLSIGNTVTGGEIWRSPDGSTWTQSGSDGLGAANNIGMYALEIFKGNLYAAGVGTVNGSKVFGTSDGSSWVETASDYSMAGNTNIVTYYLAANEGYLYAGVLAGAGPPGTGRVFRSADSSTWTQVNTDGFGDANNISVQSFYHYKGYLYAGTGSQTEGLEIYRLQDQPIATLPATGAKPSNLNYLLIIMIGLPAIYLIKRVAFKR